MDNEKQFHRRSAVLLGIFALCLAAFTALLYNAQVVHHQDYLTKSTTQVTHTEIIETSRGIITDRNGKVLTNNREIYTVSFDPKQVPKGESAAYAALRLVELFQELGLTWTDTLPITRTAPFSYTTATAGVTNRTRFEKYLNALGWSDSVLTESDPIPVMTASLRAKLSAVNETLTAPTVMTLLRERFKLDDGVPEDQRMTDQQARLVIGVLYEAELRTLSLKNYYVPPYIFAQGVSVETISILNDGGFSGVVIGQESVRQYNTDYAAHILGRVGDIQPTDDLDQLNARWAEAQGLPEGTAPQTPYRLDDQLGLDGVERAFETYLRGIEGKRIVTTNAAGKITGELYTTAPQPGCTVALTIDIDFQAAVENALAAAVEEMNAADGLETRGGAAAVVSVADGGVLALASYPNFSQRTYFEDLAEKSQDPGNPFYNRALLGTYPPGSTYKPMVAAAAMESGIITPTSKILTKGIYRFYETDNPATSYTPKCWLYRQSGGSHGLINVSQAIYHSCNYFFYEIGRLMGIETMDEYAAAFGLGQPTGIELGEKTGTLAGPAYSAKMGQLWYDGNTLQAAIGQSDNTFTPLQLASYIATLVRGGDRYAVHLLQSVRSNDGSQLLYEYQPEVLSTVELSDATLAAVKKGMGDLVTTGSVARYFQNCVVSAGAKTGSAQIGETVANGVFVCFAPFEEPEIAVAVVIEKGGSGAALAATAVDILNAYFDQSDIGAALLPEGALLP